MSKPYFALVAALVLASSAFANELEPGEILCHYRYATDKDTTASEDEWKPLTFRAQADARAPEEIWTAKPAALAQSPFNALAVSLTSRAAAPDTVEIAITTPNASLEVLDNNFFAGARTPAGVVFTTNLTKDSATIPAITLSDAAAGFPNGYVVLGLKCEQELRGIGTIWPRIRRRL